MKKLKIEKNFHNPRLFDHGTTYKSLFDHEEIIEAFNWESVNSKNLFGNYYIDGINEKEAKTGILKVFACAPE